MEDLLVTIEIEGGEARVTRKSKGVQVIIIDHDLEDEENGAPRKEALLPDEEITGEE